MRQIAATKEGISHIRSNHVREELMSFSFGLDSSNVNKCRQTVVLFKEIQKANIVQAVVNG